MPASTRSLLMRAAAIPTACALVLAGCLSACTSIEVAMPDVRGKSCAYYAARIAEMTATVERKAVEAQAEQAGFFAAAVGLSVLVPFAGLATIPAEQEARRDNVQAQSDLWSWRVAYEARDCLPALAMGEK